MFGMFGNRNALKTPMPGVISGYGGGTFNMDGTPATPVDMELPAIPPGPSLTQPMPQEQAPQQAPQPLSLASLLPPDEPSKFENMPTWKVALGGLFDSIVNQTGGKGTFIPAMLADQQRQTSSKDALAKWAQQLALKRMYPDPTALEQNVAAFQRFTPEQRTAYGAMQEAQQGPVTLTLPGNRIYSGPRSGLLEALGAQQPQQEQPTTHNTPAPTMGANGNPSYLTPDQYKAVEASMGVERTAAWAARNRIPIAKNVNGATYYQIGGKWYDNPEGL